MKVRTKTIVVDAQQWWPPSDPRHDPSMLSHRRGNAVDPPDYQQTGDLYQFSEVKGMGVDGIFFIRTGGPNDNIQVHPGDWIITGANGEKNLCRASAFPDTYEPVDHPLGVSA